MACDIWSKPTQPTMPPGGSTHQTPLEPQAQFAPQAVVPFYPFLGEGSPSKIGYRRSWYPYSNVSAGGPRQADRSKAAPLLPAQLCRLRGAGATRRKGREEPSEFLRSCLLRLAHKANLFLFTFSRFTCWFPLVGPHFVKDPKGHHLSFPGPLRKRSSLFGMLEAHRLPGP